MQINGRSLIGYDVASGTGDRFAATDPATGKQLEPAFFGATSEEVNRAAELAGAAFTVYSRLPAKRRAAFLRAIADNIEQLGEALVERAVAETGLSADRIRGERGRTCTQLSMFAQLIEEGSWVDARIDRADATRKPLPKPDVRSLLQPLGPVVVFGASNFPLAFSVAGGDTASALAAGCPVIVKSHAAHPGTGELVGHAIVDAARACEMPNGVFSLIFGAGAKVGTALVQHPAIKAGGFTGSRAGGRSLVAAAQNRPEPIPFYAEMSSTNPVFILPGALCERAQQVATGLHGSFTLGAGQFCTKPGMVFVEAGDAAKRFTQQLKEQAAASSEFVLLTRAIHKSYDTGLRERANGNQAPACSDANGFRVPAAVFETDAATFLADRKWSDEIFGPATVVVQHSSREQLLVIARGLEGQLTATIHGTESDLQEYADLVAILEQKAGRLVFNGFPTGVEVCHAMVHGGPFPATSDTRTTSVGMRAILRFARPVCYQNFPDAALPAELQNQNPLGVWRIVDGQLTRAAVAEPVAAD